MAALIRNSFRNGARFLAWRPEWSTGAAAVAAWVALGWLQFESPHGHRHAGTYTAPTIASLVSWTLMSFAMMIPVTLPAVRHVGLNSLRSRRHQAMAIYVSAYMGVWVAFGGVALAFVNLNHRFGLTERQSTVTVLALAALWQLTLQKRRAVLACRRTVPLPPGGWRAIVGCVRFGNAQAWRCLVACWPLMLLMAIEELPLWMMVFLTVTVVAEMRAPRRERLLLPVAMIFAGAAARLLLVA